MTEDEVRKIDALESSHWWYRGTREIFFSLVDPYVNRGVPLRILDVGCGTGGNLAELSRLGTASGIDLDPLCVEFCRSKGLQATVGSMLNLTVPAASIDMITMFDALSQVEARESDAVLSQMAAALKPGGLLAFREPAMPFIAGAHDRAVHVLHRLTKPGISAALRRAGFEVLRATYMNSLLFAPIVAVRYVRERLRPGHVESDVAATPELLNAALLEMLRLENAVLKRTDLPVGLSIFVAARRTAFGGLHR